MLFVFTVVTLTGLVCAFIGFLLQTLIMSGNATLDVKERRHNAFVFELWGWFLFIAGGTMYLCLATR